MLKLVIKGAPPSAALALSAHDIPIMSSLKEILSCNEPKVIWTEVLVHPCYAPRAKAWYNESRDRTILTEGELLAFHETELSELI
jgi:hypothetical protein